MRNNGREGGVAFADVEPVAELLKSLANPHRLMIVCTLVEGERAVSELERDLDIRQPSLSQHLASLREAGLILGRREAKAVFYRISDDRAARVVEALHEIFCEPIRLGRNRARNENASARREITARKNPEPVLPRANGAPRHSEAAVFAVVGDTI